MPEQVITGLKELEKALMQLDLKTSGKVLRETLKEQAKPMHAEIKNSAPVDQGALQKSIRLGSSVGRSNRSKYSARARITIGGKGTKTRSTATHAASIELGTTEREARPFIRPSFDAKVNQVLSGFKARLASKITKAGKK